MCQNTEGLVVPKWENTLFKTSLSLYETNKKKRDFFPYVGARSILMTSTLTLYYGYFLGLVFQL